MLGDEFTRNAVGGAVFKQGVQCVPLFPSPPRCLAFFFFFCSKKRSLLIKPRKNNLLELFSLLGKT